MIPKTLFSDETGPLVQYDGQFLRIEDLNPHIETRWRMSRWELVRFAIKAFFVAVFARAEDSWTEAQHQAAVKALTKR